MAAKGRDAGGDRSPRPLITRRSLVAGAAGALALCGLGALGFAPANAQVRPPGGQDGCHVLSACVHCGLCIEACPERVVAPAHVEDGVAGMRTPVMDFSRGFCNFCKDANDSHPLCVASCPTGALRLPAGATARQTLIGLARITEEDCLAFNSISCKFCVEACPYDALELDEHKEPRVVEDRCNGCGACEAACVSLRHGFDKSGSGRRAVHVDPLEEGQEAQR